MNRKKILLLLSSFWLTNAEITALADAIALAMQSSLQASYRWAAHLAGVASEWFLPAEEKQRLQTLAEQHAESIAETFVTDLDRTVNTFLDAYEAEVGSIDEGATQAVSDLLSEWIPARDGWKIPQISEYSTAIGASDGTSNFILDVLNGDTELTDDEISSLWVGVLPEDASTLDICSEYAGYMVPIAQSDELPFFPAHENCYHFIEIINTA